MKINLYAILVAGSFLLQLPAQAGAVGSSIQAPVAAELSCGRSSYTCYVKRKVTSLNVQAAPARSMAAGQAYEYRCGGAQSFGLVADNDDQAKQKAAQACAQAKAGVKSAPGTTDGVRDYRYF